MERLTKREENKIYIECGDRIDITPEEMNKIMKERLAAYEDAEEAGEGRILVFPCKVGDTLWIVSTSFNPCVVKATVEWISAQSQQENGFNIDIYARAEDGVGWTLTDYNIGKTVFLTREQAEKALEAKA